MAARKKGLILLIGPPSEPPYSGRDGDLPSGFEFKGCARSKRSLRKSRRAAAESVCAGLGDDIDDAARGLRRTRRCNCCATPETPHGLLIHGLLDAAGDRIRAATVNGIKLRDRCCRRKRVPSSASGDAKVRRIGDVSDRSRLASAARNPDSCAG